MSIKNTDHKNRWRNVIVSFRVSPEESKQLNTFVKLSGLTKQDYIIKRLLCKDIVVQGNPRVYKALRNEFAQVLDELKRISSNMAVDSELIDTIRMMSAIMDGMQEGNL